MDFFVFDEEGFLVFFEEEEDLFFVADLYPPYTIEFPLLPPNDAIPQPPPPACGAGAEGAGAGAAGAATTIGAAAAAAAEPAAAGSWRIIPLVKG